LFIFSPNTLIEVIGVGAAAIEALRIDTGYRARLACDLIERNLADSGKILPCGIEPLQKCYQVYNAAFAVVAALGYSFGTVTPPPGVVINLKSIIARTAKRTWTLMLGTPVFNPYSVSLDDALDWDFGSSSAQIVIVVHRTRLVKETGRWLTPSAPNAPLERHWDCPAEC
jgi:hypothetical protein